MDKAKIKSYLLYSLGEIVLIVVGVLLAVQINNWNQNRINVKKELQALKDLEKEFNLNEERINEKQLARISITPQIKKYIQLIASEKADYESFKNFHSNGFVFGMTNPSNGVIDALISSSEISLISNDSLKYFLTDWKNKLENLYENEEILWNSGLDFINCTSKQYPDTRYNWVNWDSKSLELASKKLISDLEYRNKLVGFEGCNEIVIEECQYILNDIKKIKKLLRNEIVLRE